MSNIKTSVKLNFLINEEMKSIIVNIDQKISELNQNIENTFKIKLKDYNLYISNDKITNFEKSLREVLGKETTPKIEYKKRERYDISKETISSNENKEDKFINKVIIENFPSRPEMIELIHKFTDEDNKKYNVLNKDSIIEIVFEKPETAYQFIMYMNMIKMKNTLYSKIKTYMIIDIKKTRSNNIRTKSYDKSLELNLNNTKRGLSVKEKNKRMINESSILRISAPYISEDEIVRKEYKENKNKWIVKQDFIKHTGKSSGLNNFIIPNYVGKTPSMPPLLHQFRTIEKKKWIDSKNFYVI